ncbi:MAG TPA: hypothetical protein VEB64_16715, partial [Azospirillaceae bacterium]|nr:hypothetical protein [Azospirillaceae bacterium]
MDQYVNERSSTERPSAERPASERTGTERAAERRRLRQRHSLLGAVAFTAFVLGLIALSIEAVVGELGIVLIASVLAVVAIFH